MVNRLVTAHKRGIPGKRKVPKDPEKLKRALARRQRDERAINMRIAGASYRAIAQALDYSSAGLVYNKIQSYLEHLNMEPTQNLVKTELSRLDVMQSELWKLLLQGDVSVISTVMRIMEMRAKYAGLDNWQNNAESIVQHAINQTQVLVIQGNEPEYLEKMRQATGVEMPQFDYREVGQLSDDGVKIIDQTEYELSNEDVAKKNEIAKTLKLKRRPDPSRTNPFIIARTKTPNSPEGIKKLDADLAREEIPNHMPINQRTGGQIRGLQF